MSERGKYIVIEGHDGTGKSTQVEPIRELLAEHGIQSLAFHEPDGLDETPMASEIRTLIKNGSIERQPGTNVGLFSTARHEIWQSARAKINQGLWVVAARNYYSTLVYQGYGEGVSMDFIYKATELFTDKTYMNPDLALILLLEDETIRSERITARGELTNPDTFESRDSSFQDRLKSGYVELALERNIPTIDASQPKGMVTDKIWQHVKKLIL